MNKSDTLIKELQKRSNALYNKNGFIERLMMPIMELISHDAAAVTEAEDVGFSMHGINYGFPQELMIEWVNQDAINENKGDGDFKSGARSGCLTLESSRELSNQEGVGKELLFLHGKHGFHATIMTIFFSSNGRVLGIYALSRKPDNPFTGNEKKLFHTVAPYIFYAFRKYKKLIELDFYNSHNLERQVFGVVIAEKNRVINWSNSISKSLLTRKYRKMPKRLPQCLEEALGQLAGLSRENKTHSNFYRDITYPCSYGQVLCFRYDIFSSMFLPVSGEGFVFIIDTKHIENTTLSALSNREIDVLRLIAEGLSDKKISSMLNISEKTVQTYTHKLFRKLNVSNRTGAAVEAVKLKII